MTPFRIETRMRRSVLALAMVACLTSAAAAQEATPNARVLVAPLSPEIGTATLDGKVRGEETLTVLFDAAPGQDVAVTVESNHRQAQLDVFAPDGTSLHDGTRGGLSWTGKAAAEGRFAARLMLSTAAARRGEAATLRVSVSVTGTPVAEPATAADDAAPPPDGDPAQAKAADAASDAPKTEEDLAREAVDPAKPRTGAERYWAVTGVPSRDMLPVYEQPGVETTIIGTLPPDAVGLKNLGCRMAGGARWCKVEVGANPRKEGWVAGRYLRAVSSRERSPDAAAGGRRLRTITGIVACTPAKAEAAGQCETRIQKAAPGLAMVYVTLPDGVVRVLNFRGGDIFVLNPDVTIKWKAKGKDYVVTLTSAAGTETLAIPKLVIDGGARPAVEPAAPVAGEAEASAAPGG
jgi:hypothetical protein